ncbi:hypothetical protein BUZ39_18835, partial [Staphylococcus haemolyticus]
YVAITDAKSTIEDKDKSKKEKQSALADIKEKVKSLNIKDNKEGKDVKSKLEAVDKASSMNAKADKLSQLTKSLIAYEDAVSTKDISGEIKTLKQQVAAKDDPIKKAIKSKNESELQSINNSLNQIWTTHETAIRNYDEGK